MSDVFPALNMVAALLFQKFNVAEVPHRNAGSGWEKEGGVREQLL